MGNAHAGEERIDSIDDGKSKLCGDITLILILYLFIYDDS
jgi:hypothetical protein